MSQRPCRCQLSGRIAPENSMPQANHAGGSFSLIIATPRPQDATRMGRMFEVRKHTMFARWNRMAKQFAKIGKDITIAVKAGGPDPVANPQLRRVVQNARAVNMP